MSKLLAIIGATATGKSELAFNLAKEFKASILSCDSLLVYKGLTIGTAKPSIEEMQKVPHYGIDLIEPNDTFNAGNYVRYAKPIIDEHIKKDKPLLIVGGTGFYLKALLFGVWDTPPTQPEIRAKLEEEVAGLPEDERKKKLHQKLTKLDPVYAKKVNQNDVYRVIRALEIIQITKEPLSEQLEKTNLQNPLPHKMEIFGIQRHKMDLERRIRTRTDSMFEKGIVQETKELLESYPEIPKCFKCVGYNEVLQHLGGQLSIQECREKIAISTRQLAKKQRTFFNGIKAEINWYQLPSDEANLLSRARDILS